jgi:hypothetical protein
VRDDYDERLIIPADFSGAQQGVQVEILLHTCRRFGRPTISPTCSLSWTSTMRALRYSSTSGTSTTWAYLRKASSQGVSHAEILFDPQAHSGRGVGLGTIVTGLHRALKDGERRLGMSSHLILCFLRHLSAEEAT